MTGVPVLRQPLAVRVVSVVALGALAIVLPMWGFASGGVLAWLGPVVAVVVAAVAVRTWLLRAVIAPEALTLVNTFRTRTFSWADIDRVVYNGGVQVRLRSGREVSVAAFSQVPGAFPAVSRRNATAAKRLQAAVKHYKRH